MLKRRLSMAPMRMRIWMGWEWGWRIKNPAREWILRGVLFFPPGGRASNTGSHPERIAEMRWAALVCVVVGYLVSPPPNEPPRVPGRTEGSSAAGPMAYVATAPSS